ncbi:MAG: cytochrome c biogenesis protein CcsA [Verrucomicrobia bacterium]|nr:cytochrome c biogenesis protein CcsA [Verrucomicrobiota bacterium]MCH8513191.1 cytochrome c biogenesis protein CcsA [Kiritimatiellia bacterium]
MKKLFPILTILLLSTFQLAAQHNHVHRPAPEAPDRVLDRLGALPVLHDGRVMPLDTFARIHLTQFSGRKTLMGKSAMEIMGEILFEPSSTHDYPLFLVNNHAVLEAMGVEIFQEAVGDIKASSRRFSYHHLMPGIAELQRLAVQANQMEPEDRGPVEQEILRLYSNVLTYRYLELVFEYLRPTPMLGFDDPDLRNALGLDANRQFFSYAELRPKAQELSTQLTGGAALAEMQMPLTQENAAIQVFLMQLMNFSSLSQDMPFNVLPAAPHGEPVWMAPFDARYGDHQDRELREAATRLSQMAVAWMTEDWNEVIAAYEDVVAFSRDRMKHVRDVGLTVSEARYNRANLFGKARFFYLIGFFLAFAAMLTGKDKWRKFAWLPMGLAAIWHLTGLIWRIYLTARPPVTNLYSTFLWVGLVCLILAFVIEYFIKNGLGLFSGGLICYSFLMLAERFGMEGDTLHKMEAVLSSNFWLSTHVLAVTTGYAGVFIAGVFGHIWLVMRLLNRPAKQLQGVMDIMMPLMGFGLTFAFLGTMLGGVWADQSWGRFWGWDPKENGAILIVLWTAVVYHARIAGMVREIGTAAGAAFGCVMVMVAWLGVNLLGVGLHSYGFTNAMAVVFNLYVGAELVFICLVVGILKIKESAPPADSESSEASNATKSLENKAPVGIEMLAGAQLLWGIMGLCIFLVVLVGFSRPGVTLTLRKLGLSQFYLGITAFVLFSGALAGGIGLGARKAWGWIVSTTLMLFIVCLKIAALVKLELRLANMARENFLEQFGQPKTLAFQHLIPMVLAFMIFLYLMKKPIRAWCGVKTEDFVRLMIILTGVAAGMAIVFTTMAMVLS